MYRRLQIKKKAGTPLHTPVVGWCSHRAAAGAAARHDDRARTSTHLLPTAGHHSGTDESEGVGGWSVAPRKASVRVTAWLV
ncbi:hypothetical protein [Streptomyces sp. NBC_00328]|uniref:hypothetical protein n=1 Tax=Streptomyces sp. NBC_00328 TaxID=2903646 RepID=UPI002E2D34DC|nr:hypothetical protein [Streptomyces sp. NBC_00328]